MNIEELKSILSDMDVPRFRREELTKSNVRWLLRNLAVRNRNHPEFSAVLSSLRSEKQGI